MTFTSTGLLTYLDYGPLTFTPGTPNSGEFLSTAAPKIAGNFTNLFAATALSPQRMLWYNKPTHSGVLSTFNTGSTALGAGTNNPNSVNNTTNLSRRRYRHYDTGTTAQANAGIRAGAGSDHGVRGSIAGVGGFIVRHRIGLVTIPASSFRFFTGIIANGAEPTATAEPSTYINCVGLGKDSGDSSMSIIVNDASGTATKIPLDVGTIPIAAGTIYDLTLACAPGASQDVAYRVRTITGLDDEGNDTYGAELTGTISTDLPATDTALTGALTLINNAANASNFVVGILSQIGVRL